MPAGLAADCVPPPPTHPHRGGPPCAFKSNPGMVFTLFQKIDNDGSGDLGARQLPTLWCMPVARSPRDVDNLRALLRVCVPPA